MPDDPAITTDLPVEETCRMVWVRTDEHDQDVIVRNVTEADLIQTLDFRHVDQIHDRIHAMLGRLGLGRVPDEEGGDAASLFRYAVEYCTRYLDWWPDDGDMARIRLMLLNGNSAAGLDTEEAMRQVTDEDGRTDIVVDVKGEPFEGTECPGCGARWPGVTFDLKEHRARWCPGKRPRG